MRHIGELKRSGQLLGTTRIPKPGNRLSSSTYCVALSLAKSHAVNNPPMEASERRQRGANLLMGLALRFCREPGQLVWRCRAVSIAMSGPFVAASGCCAD
jgi:hypothetical protein